MESSPLSRLSPELRNRIYEFALHERRPVAISKNYPSDAPLLRTCKQIRREAELLFYSVNSFTCLLAGRDDKNVGCLRRWLITGPARKLTLIKSLTIRVEFPWCRLHGAELDQEDARISTGSETMDVSNLLYETSFGDRPKECVVDFIVHGREDDKPFKEIIVLGHAESGFCTTASFKTWKAVFGPHSPFPHEGKHYAEFLDQLRTARGKMTMEETRTAARTADRTSFSHG